MVGGIGEILVPTVNGGDLVRLYDLHRIRFRDTALAFVWLVVAVLRWARKRADAA